MRAMVVTAAVVLVACGPQQQVPNCNRVSIVSGEAPAAVSLINEQVTVSLLGLSEVICAVGGPVATEVVVEVRDEQNLLVVETHTPPQKQRNGFSTDVTFTPTKPGVYFLEARFEPAVTATQRRHIVVDDKADQSPQLIATVSESCDALYPVGEMIICTQPPTLFSFWLDGGVVERSHGRVAADDGIAWLDENSPQRRVTFSDGGVRSTEFSLRPDGVPGADAERLVLATPREVREVVVTDGGLETRSKELASPSSLLSAPGIAVAGDAFAWVSEQNACVRGAAGAQCRAVEHKATRVERDTVWVKSPGAVSGLAQWRVFPNGTALLRAVNSSPVLLEVSNVPAVFTWNGRYVTVRRDDLTFEAWPRIDQVEQFTVTPSHVVFRTKTNEVRVYRR